MGKIRSLVLFILVAIVFFACKSAAEKPLFTKLNSAYTGVNFSNLNIDSDTLNILDYLYYYNGAGVAVGDFNNDGLPDIFFTSNTNGNKLYLNKGNFKFEDISEKAGILQGMPWETGVSLVDINGDGFLDIYICAVSNHKPVTDTSNTFFKNSHNLLYINNGNNTFTESSHQYGLDIMGYNTQAVFFDYDHDGDLDMFLLQHSTHGTDKYGDSSIRSSYSEVSGGKLYRNDGGHFTNVTKGSGIISSPVGYGLGVGVADFNQDGWEDIYVSNDFQENDYYYINQKNGTFKEMNREAFGHESKFSMGNDIADLNNDGWPDIMTLDMLPEDEKVLKSSQSDVPYDVYEFQKKFGYYNQYSRNCLQLNTGKGYRFSDIALYSGVAATDWSWSPLIADFDLDGYKDIFVTSGIKKRQNDLDYIRFLSGIQYRQMLTANARENDQVLLANQPDGRCHNYLFKGNENLQFEDKSATWGFADQSLSNGSAYADLDGDGSLDLVVNNMNSAAGIFQNNIRKMDSTVHYLTIQLKGPSPNTFAIGAKVFLFANHKLIYDELQTVHGFLSSSEPILHFGLGKVNEIDSAVIIWPNNTRQTLKHIKANQKLTIIYQYHNVDSLAQTGEYITRLLHGEDKQIFQNITKEAGIDFIHQENVSFVDFNSQWFIPHEISTQGPKIAVADVNNDGLEDFFICGANGQASALYVQKQNGTFEVSASNKAVFEADKNSEAVDAVFFDANGDGFPDLYVVSGGNEYTGNAKALLDHLYINDGKGNYSKSEGLPLMYENKSVVCVADFDKDGDLDLFVGGRVVANNYGKIPSSWLLENDGKGHFKNITYKIPGLEHIGMVTGASWIDVDHDGWPDLLITGEWMQPVLFKNNKGKFTKVSLTKEDDKLKGLWSGLQVADVNGDGYDDILIGNYGLNSKLKTSSNYPLKLYIADIAGVNRTNQILTIAKEGKYYTFLGKEDLDRELPYLRKEFLSYQKMAGKTVEEIFGKKLDNASVLTANNLETTLLVNDGNGKFFKDSLPFPIQWSPVFAFAVDDFQKNGKKDILSAGNFYGTIPFEGRYDAMPLLLNLNNGSLFTPELPLEAAFTNITGEVRCLRKIDLANGKKGLLVAINNGPLQLLQY